MQHFEVRKEDSAYYVFMLEESAAGIAKKLIATVAGGVFETKLTMTDPTTGDVLATMTHNFVQTKFECFDANGAKLGDIAFPWFYVQQKFSIVAGEREFLVEGGGHHEYKAHDPEGRMVFHARTDRPGLFAFDRHYELTLSEALIPRELALLGTVALGERRT